MLIEIGILIISYYGVKRNGKNAKNKNPEEGMSSKPKTESQTNQDSEDKVDCPKEQLQHYNKMALLSMGLSGIRQFIFPPLAPISLALYIYTAIPYMRDVEKALIKDKKIDVNVLFFVADILTLYVNQYFAASFGIWLMHTGKMSIEKAKDDSKKMISDVFEQIPQTAWILVDDVEVEVPIKDVKANDILVVQTGEVIPVDGVILEGLATIDQQSFTGESQPAEKGEGDCVFASTVILAGRINIKVLKSGRDTTLSSINDILIHSIDFKSKAQLKGEEWADKATLPMLGIAGILLPVVGPVATAVFINSHIGNRIRILAPLGTLNHITKASKKGILVKDGRAIESLCQVDTVLFDKTGTLTSEEPEVKRIIACGKYKENTILGYAAAAERRLTHPIARAILKKAEEVKLNIADIDDSKYQIGYGIIVLIGRKTIKVGSARFMKEEGASIPDSINDAQADSHSKGNSLVLVAVNDKVCGAIELQPHIRPEVKDVISGLRMHGIKHIAIVSGDHKTPTEKLAQELCMDDYYYDILPEGKARVVEQLQDKNKTVCFIGDGLNDTIAMDKANVSISLCGATTIATDRAEIILMDGSLSSLCELFDISKSLDANLKSTLNLTIAPGVINMGGAFLLHYGVLTSLMVNTTFGAMVVHNVMQPVKLSKKAS